VPVTYRISARPAGHEGAGDPGVTEQRVDGVVVAGAQDGAGAFEEQRVHVGGQREVRR